MALRRYLRIEVQPRYSLGHQTTSAQPVHRPPLEGRASLMSWCSARALTGIYLLLQNDNNTIIRYLSRPAEKAMVTLSSSTASTR